MTRLKTALKPYPQFMADLELCADKSDVPFTRTEAEWLFEVLQSRNYLRLGFNYNGCPQRRVLIQNLLEARAVKHGYIEMHFENGGDLSVWAYHTAAIATLASDEQVVFDLPEKDKLTSTKEFAEYWISQGEARHAPRKLMRNSYDMDPKHAIYALFAHKPNVIQPSASLD